MVLPIGDGARTYESAWSGKGGLVCCWWMFVWKFAKARLESSEERKQQARTSEGNNHGAETMVMVRTETVLSV
jgi:hypothetical protein